MDSAAHGQKTGSFTEPFASFVLSILTQTVIAMDTARGGNQK